VDIRLTKSGDLDLTDMGDIQLTESIQQDILIHLRWIFEEWRLGPEFGLPYFQDILVKNPNIEIIKRDIVNEILKCDKVVRASIEDINYNPADRTLKVIYKAETDEDSFREEVELYA
jgi:hypothetical protein